MKDLKIKTRLTIAFGTILGLIGIIIITSVLLIRKNNEISNEIIKHVLEDQSLALEWNMLTKVNGERTMARIMTTDGTYDAKLKEEMVSTSARISAIQEELAKKTDNDTVVTGLLQEISKKRTNYVTMRDDIFKAKAIGDIEKVKSMFETKFVPQLREYEASIESIPIHYKKQIEKMTKEMDEKMGAGFLVFACLGVLTSLVGFVSIWYIPASITNPLKDALKIAESVAKGDLSIRISSHSKDETGDLLRSLAQMQESLRRIVQGIRDGTNSIVTNSDQILQGNKKLSGRTEQAVAALEETASSMVELASTVQTTAETAKRTSQGADLAAETTKRGGRIVHETVQTMGRIAESSKKISEIISVIDGIAFQTNILALNAAVEAARAGEHGKGFAVVASEVRSLAQRSAESAKEIKTLITLSVARVEIGLKQVHDAGNEMQDIMGGIHNVQEMMQEISHATHEQSKGIRAAESAIAQIEQGTEQNVSLAEEATGAAESLQATAKRLVALVSKFRLA